MQAVVQYAEDDIRDDPDHEHWRRALGEVRYDYSIADKGLLIAFRVLSTSTVELTELIDIRKTRKP